MKNNQREVFVPQKETIHSELGMFVAGCLASLALLPLYAVVAGTIVYPILKLQKHFSDNYRQV